MGVYSFNQFLDKKSCPTDQLLLKYHERERNAAPVAPAQPCGHKILSAGWIRNKKSCPTDQLLLKYQERERNAAPVAPPGLTATRF